MTDADIAARIVRRRKQCLVHRFLYYVRSESLVSDYQYDMWERELRALVEQYPEIAAAADLADDCPTKQVGSSNLWDYPRETQTLGDSLLIYNPENLDWWVKIQTILEEKENGTWQSGSSGEIVQPTLFG